MIPATRDDLRQAFEITVPSSRTLRLHPSSQVVAGYVDGLEAVKQAVFLILNIERYEHLIHSWDIGIELADLIGQPISFCLPEIKRRVTEALLQDDRISGVDDFDFTIAKDRVGVSFTVQTIFGAIQAEREVAI